MQESVGHRARGRQVLVAALITGIILGAVIALHAGQMPDRHVVIFVRLGWYGTAVVFLIGAKLILSLLARPARDTPESRSTLRRAYVAGIITCRNEDVTAFTLCLNSILASTRLPNSLTVVDDGSSDPACGRVAYRYYEMFRAARSELTVVTLSENRGKRAGLAAGFARSGTPTFTCALIPTPLLRLMLLRTPSSHSRGGAFTPSPDASSPLIGTAIYSPG